MTADSRVECDVIYWCLVSHIIK
ncbi:unnamed protein product [Spirodela intermedia]|uniref:PsaA n=1 Tax=Spirodela intermedia TaxID=51605 RepID=A0ABN7ECH4_SPIIN|nr:unnamed protein product [Spirodela intermedia]